ncbi:MAG: NADH-quinone oxidoreductase subunit L, partial [Deltaproteobacteria bacterium]|nr:NADH-quinone oxidoreductase subunit L [Deltaproteobacteria bacterium]
MDHPVQTDFLRWIVLFPLLGAAVNGLLGARIQEQWGKRAVAFIACAPVTLSFLFSLWAFGRLLGLPAKERFLIDAFYTWIPMGSFSVDVAFWVDPLSAIMILVVSGIGGLIHFYSIGYMHEDRSLWRYFAYLNLFTFSMLLLV